MAASFFCEKAFAVGAQKKLIKKKKKKELWMPAASPECPQVKFEAVIDHRRNLGGLWLFIFVYWTLITKK